MATLSKIFSSTSSYAYDDLILMPGYVTGPLDDIDLHCRLTPSITLALPIVSSPMDTVTSPELAIGLALEGGIGIIHVNQTIEEAVDMVRKVKRFHNGIIHEPVTVNAGWTVGKVKALQEDLGFTGFPVVNDDGITIGIVSRRDMDFADDEDCIFSVCVKGEDIICGRVEEPFEVLVDRIKRHKVSRLPIFGEPGILKGLICRKDIRVRTNHPHATMDSQNHLRVGAAVTTHPGDQLRVTALVEAGVDVLVIDSSNGASCYQLEMLRWIHSNYPSMEVICGNVVTVEQGRLLLDAGAAALRVGMGVGSICTPQEVCGVGRCQASAVYHLANLIRTTYPERGLIADGGISSSGKIIKAFALGATCVMMGSMLAGTDEAPGDYFVKEGVRVKTYRGMGSIAAQRHQGSRVRYSGSSRVPTCIVAQGVSGTVTSKGPIAAYLATLVKAVKHGLQNLGVSTLSTLSPSSIRAEVRTPASCLEGGVHNLFSIGAENP